MPGLIKRFIFSIGKGENHSILALCVESLLLNISAIGGKKIQQMAKNGSVITCDVIPSNFAGLPTCFQYCSQAISVLFLSPCFFRPNA